MKNNTLLPVALLASLAMFGNVAQAESMFAKGSQGLTLVGGQAFPIGNDDEYYTNLGGGYSYYFLDKVAVTARLDGFYAASTESNDTFGGGFSLIPRWHYFERDKLSLFIDGGLGVSYWDDRLTTPDGTRFNFIVRAGAGLTYELKQDWFLVTGIEWLHFSNAGMQGSDRHPGSNALSTYVGLMWMF